MHTFNESWSSRKVHGCRLADVLKGQTQQPREHDRVSDASRREAGAGHGSRIHTD